MCGRASNSTRPWRRSACGVDGGVVEKANHTAAQRWWTLPDDVTTAEAQESLDRFCERVTDHRKRVDAAGNCCTVADLAAAERLRPVPAAPPIAVITVERTATAQALVHYRGTGTRCDLSDARVGYPATIAGQRDQLIVVESNGIRLVQNTAVTALRFDEIGTVSPRDIETVAGDSIQVLLYSNEDTEDFVDRLRAAGVARPASQPAFAQKEPRVAPIPKEHMVTTPTFPGHRIRRVLGVVSELSPTSGFTGSTKGTGRSAPRSTVWPSRLPCVVQTRSSG